MRSQNEALFNQFARARRMIFLAAVAATIGIAITYPIGFQVLLGPQWATAGWISMIFAPFFGAMIYLTPLSVSLNTFKSPGFRIKDTGPLLCDFGILVRRRYCIAQFVDRLHAVLLVGLPALCAAAA